VRALLFINGDRWETNENEAGKALRAIMDPLESGGHRLVTVTVAVPEAKDSMVLNVNTGLVSSIGVVLIR
jgi:hypothetical protein